MLKKISVIGWIIRFIFFLVFEYIMYLIAGARGNIKKGVEYLNFPSYMSDVLEHPFENYYNRYTITTLVIGAIIYFLIIVYMLSRKHNLMIGREYGDAKFADPRQISKKLSDKSTDGNDPENIVVMKKRFWRK